MACSWPDPSFKSELGVHQLVCRRSCVPLLVWATYFLVTDLSLPSRVFLYLLMLRISLLRSALTRPTHYPSIARSMSTTHYDAIVIGSGQGGTPLAKAFAGSGHRTALVERAHLGGCCVNEGCTPTKTMIASGRVAYLARRGPDYGVSFGDSTVPKTNEVKVEMEKVRQRKRDIVTSFRSGSERGVKSAGVDVLMGAAAFHDAKTLQVSLNEGEERMITADRIFINTGERPTMPNIAGLTTSDGSSAFPPDVILDSTSIQELATVPSHLLVVGGGYIGLEFGQLFRRLGANVTVVQRALRLLPREDPEISEELLKILIEDGVDVRLSTSPTHLAPGDAPDRTVTMTVQDQQGKQDTIHGSHVLFAAGRTPNTDTLNLSAAGVKTTSRGHVEVTPELQTSVPHIWALGDVKGGPAFTHLSYDDFRILNANLLQSPSPVSPLSITDRVVPYVVYTDPQLGHVGLHAAEARQKYGADKVKVASMPMAWVARALETDESRGKMKVVIETASERILGFTCLGLEGGELMGVVQMAIVAGASWTKLRDACWAHPSLAESLNNIWPYLK
jgi:pyruvate/2-oxoglutarate dehydrogenase complex dihydrolipoamide dehydrogenase (E3) component